MMTQEEFNKHYKEFLMNVGDLDMRTIMKLKGCSDEEFNEKIGNAISGMKTELAKDSSRGDKMDSPVTNGNKNITT